MIYTQLGACVSGATQQRLDRSYERLEVRQQELRLGVHAPEHARLDLPGALQRDRVVAEVLAVSPSLRALSHRVRALLSTARAQGALPSSELNVQARNLPKTRPLASDFQGAP